MTPTLIYDAATMSRTPWRALVFAVGFAVCAIAFWAWQHMHERAAGPLFAFLLIGSILFSLVAGLTEYEKRLIGRKSPLQVEGHVEALWEQRTVRQASKRDYTDWQGFRIRGVDFAYVRNTDQNYFNNAGDYRIDLAEGMRLRVHYLEKHKKDRVIRYIVRVECFDPLPTKET